jgi:hypothetical protein
MAASGDKRTSLAIRRPRPAASRLVVENRHARGIARNGGAICGIGQILNNFEQASRPKVGYSLRKNKNASGGSAHKK